MPKYAYWCEACDVNYEFSHSMTERPELKCECEEVLVKIPSPPLNLKLKHKKSAVGSVVNSSIEEFKKDLKKQQDESKREI
tara:strand:+ start:17377 stop:17619 length:243 start_codon:yes stop_codon:yes gene_type:complete